MEEQNADKIFTSTDHLARQERSERILNAAAALLLRWGYKRVTIENIAQEADVGTGTIYLHWKTKEALFETVLLRELVAVWRVLLEGIRAEPTEALLHRLMSALLLNIKRRPLACALFTKDIALLGKLSQSTIARQSQQMAGSDEWITLLRRLGLLRTDDDSDVQGYAFSAIWTGFMLVDELLPEDEHTVLEKQSGALAQTIRRTFEPEVLPSTDTLQQVVAPTMIDFFEKACAHYQQQMAERLITPKESQTQL